MLTRDATGNLIRVPKGLANQILTMNGTADAIIWKNGDNLISLNNLTDVIITNPQITECLKYNGTEWINEKLYISDATDVNIASPTDMDVLVYSGDKFINRRLTNADIDNAVTNLNQLGDTNIVAPQTNQFLRQTPQGKWANQSVSSQDIPEGGTSLYYNDTRVGNYLKTILTTEFDLLTRDGNNNLVRIPKGTSNQMLSMNQTADGIIWKDPSENISLNGLSDVTINNVANSQSLIYNVFTAQWENKSLTTDQVSQGLDVNRQYYTNQKVLDLLLDTLPEESILMNNGGNIEGLQKGATGTYLRSNDTSIAYSQVLYNEIRERQTMVRENITIPANGSINMLEWLMNSNIFNDMILPVGSPVNPFDWSTRGQQDYGMWHITNGSNQEITLDRVNIDLAANFIIWNFIRSLIANIMDDNLQDGTVRIRPLGINHDQQGGDAQIINTTVNQLGRFRTLKQGTGITLTQTDNDITISSTGSYTNTDVSNYLLSILTSNEDILIRRANVLSRLPHAVGLNDYLSYNAINGQLEWKTMPNAGVDSLRLLQDCFLVPEFPFPNGKYVLFHDTNSGLDSWENHILDTSDILNLDNALNSKIPLSTVNAAGDLIIANGNQSVTNLPLGADNEVLTIINGNIEWAAAQGGATTLNSLTDVNLTTPAQGQVLYKSNGDWVNQNLQISDITNLQTTIDGKLNNNFTAYGQIVIGSGGSSYQTFPKGNDNTFLQVQNGFLEYSAVTIPKVTNLQTTLDSKINSNILTTEGDILIRGATSLERLPIGNAGQFLGNVNGNLEYGNVSLNVSQLNDVNITNLQNGQVIRYNNTSTDWENITLDTSMIPENTNMYFTFERVDTNLKNKYNGKGVLQVGTQNLDYTQLPGPIDNESVLYCNTASTTGLEWKKPSTSNITEGTNLYYTDTRVDTRLNSKYTTKGRFLISNGANSYVEQNEPTSTFQVLTSDINNVLNPTGLSWAQLALNNSYFSNLNIDTPLNKQLLSYDTATAKWKNQTFDGTFALPLIAPNNINYWGGANIPFQTKNGTGIGTRIDGTNAISFFVANTEYFTVGSNFVGLSSNTPQFTIANGGSAASPRLLFGTTGIGVFSNAGADRWSWARQGTTHGWIDATSLNTQTRLDVKNTKIQDFAMDINNIFNSYSMRNSTGTTTYFTVDTANNRCRMPNQFFSSVLKLDNAPNLDTNVTLNNNWFNLTLGTGASLSVSNNALSTPYSVNYVANSDEITINNLAGRSLRFDVSFSFLIDKNVGVVDFACWNMNDNVEIVQSHARMRCDANYYYNYSKSFTFSPVLATQRISIKVKCSQGATVVITLTNLNFDVYDLML
ncbi:MAG TPA: hypothetical protein V6C58_18350 [Allocoleopsis sp.]